MGEESIKIIQDGIQGSVLANLLLCLGIVLLLGGIKKDNRPFDINISETAINLLLVSIVIITVPGVLRACVRRAASVPSTSASPGTENV